MEKRYKNYNHEMTMATLHQKKIAILLFLALFTYKSQDCSVAEEVKNNIQETLLTDENIEEIAPDMIREIADAKNNVTNNYLHTITTDYYKNNKLIGSEIINKDNIIETFKIYYSEQKSKNFIYTSGLLKKIVYRNGNNSLLRVDFIGIDNQIESSKMNKSDGSTMYTYIFSDGTKKTLNFDSSGTFMQASYVDQRGIETTVDANVLVAWHEAAHAILSIKTRNLRLVSGITIKPNNGVAGKVSHQNTYNESTITIQEIENWIMVLLGGAVGEQIALNMPQFNNKEDFLFNLQDPRYASDEELCIKNFKELLHIKSSQNYSEDGEKSIFRYYQDTYHFLNQHKKDLLIIVQELIDKEYLSGDDAYNLIFADKPLRYNEEGPLPLTLAEDYIHRGFNSSTIEDAAHSDSNKNNKPGFMDQWSQYWSGKK